MKLSMPIITVELWLVDELVTAMIVILLVIPAVSMFAIWYYANNGLWLALVFSLVNLIHLLSMMILFDSGTTYQF